MDNHRLATRLYCAFTFIMYKCMPAFILHRDLWHTVGHLVHIVTTRGGCNGSISNYPPSIPQCHLYTSNDIYIWPGGGGGEREARPHNRT